MKCLTRLALLFTLTLGGRAVADSAAREASAHFQRGVDLYGDGDYRGALVEFKKAHTLWPRANVLYDIGQTEFQLLDYAGALRSFERFLADTGPNAAHRNEVEAVVETLRGRVGRIAVITDAPDCDVTIDDQSAGTTPVAHPLLVSVGPRRVAVSCPGRSPMVRRVEVAAAETVRVDLRLPATGSVRLTGPAPPPPRKVTKRSLIIGWTLTGILLAGTVGLGASALTEQGRLDAMKADFPVTRDALDRQSALTLGLSITADVLGAATLVAAGVATYLSVKYERKVTVGFNGRGIALAGNF